VRDLPVRRILTALRGLRLLPLTAASAALLLLAACAAPEATFERGLIWQVEGAGAKPSYVFGTMHSTDARLHALPPEVRAAFDGVEIAAFELDDSLVDQQQMAQSVRLPAGRRLEDILGPELFQSTAEAVAPLGIPPAALQQLKPWTLIGLLGVPREEVLRTAQGQPPLDGWLQAEARRRGKAVHGLETVAEQTALFENMTEAEQVVMVTDLVNNYELVEEQYGRLLNTYLAGDAVALMAEIDDLSRTTDVDLAIRFRQQAIDDRNRLMVERMLPLMARDATFVAVGAAHLPGEAGIVRLLQQGGFAVTRLE